MENSRRCGVGQGLPPRFCSSLSIAALTLDPLEPPTRMVARPSRDAVDGNRRAFLNRRRGGDLHWLAQARVAGVTDDNQHEIGHSVGLRWLGGLAPKNF